MAEAPYFLVADDSSVIRKVARRICEDLSIRVAEAEDAEQMLEVCRDEMPDAIMVDWHIRGSDAFDLIKELRGMEHGKDPKVLFCMTEFNLAQIARAKRAGADDHLLKPFDKEVMQAKLKEIGLL